MVSNAPPDSAADRRRPGAQLVNSVCQGRVCGLSGVSAMSQRQNGTVPLPALNERLEQIGRIRGQAPVMPLPVAPVGVKTP